MNTAFKALHRATLAMSMHLLAQATQGQLEAVEHALDRGASLTLETGPMPDPEHVALIVVWPDGSRAVACHISIKRDSLQ